MKVWMVYVTVKERTAGAPRTICRWLDSQWAQSAKAKERQRELENSMRHFDCYRAAGTDQGASAEIIEGSVADAAIAEIPDAVSVTQKSTGQNSPNIVGDDNEVG